MACSEVSGVQPFLHRLRTAPKSVAPNKKRDSPLGCLSVILCPSKNIWKNHGQHHCGNEGNDDNRGYGLFLLRTHHIDFISLNFYIFVFK